MKITILPANISSNCMGRSYILAKILQRSYEVEIVGPMFGNGIWAPVANDKSVKYIYRNMKGAQIYNISKWRQLYKKADGEILYVNKPLLTSFVLALFKKVYEKTPIVLDIDDWEIGFLRSKFKERNVVSRILNGTLKTKKPLTPLYVLNVLVGNAFIKIADDITTSNTFLQEKYGGTIIVHGRDTSVFDPNKYNKNELRQKIEISLNKKVVCFLGTAQPYKGIEDLIYAFKDVNAKNAFLLIVGLGKDDYSNTLRDLAKTHLKKETYLLLEKQPFDKLPEFIVLSDAIVIPQQKNVATEGQLPAKLFDAMSLETPTITTDVGDIKKILGDNGFYFTPGNVEELHKKIDEVLENLDEAKNKAKKTRVDCIKKYDWLTLHSKLQTIFEKYSTKG